jgi:dephospho-CoA kinase
MIIVGLTGNLASGKTEAAKMFKRLGAQVHNADDAARRLTRKGTDLHKAIVKIFGKQFLAPDGELDRKKLAARVFSRPAELKKLNTLIHPGVILEAYKAIEKSKSKKGVMVLDVPLLFEAKMEKLVDFTVVVLSDDRTILARAKKRGLDAAMAKNILRSQWPAAKKARLAHYVIQNDGTPKELEAKVKNVFERINRL